MATLLWELCKLAWNDKKIPGDWRENIIMPIHKKAKTKV